MSNWTSCTRTLRSRRDIENVDKQSVQLIVLVSMLPTVPGMLVLVEYSNDEIRPMVATALPALDWFSGRPACPRRPHCPRCPKHNNTHTHNHTIAASAAVSAPGGAAGTQRSSGAAGDGRRRVRRVQRTPAWAAAGPRDFAGPTDLAAADRQQGCSAIRPWERPPEAAVPYEPSGRGSRTPDAVARQALGRAAVRRAPA